MLTVYSIVQSQMCQSYSNTPNGKPRNKLCTHARRINKRMTNYSIGLLTGSENGRAGSALPLSPCLPLLLSLFQRTVPPVHQWRTGRGTKDGRGRPPDGRIIGNRTIKNAKSELPNNEFRSSTCLLMQCRNYRYRHIPEVAMEGHPFPPKTESDGCRFRGFAS